VETGTLATHSGKTWKNTTSGPEVENPTNRRNAQKQNPYIPALSTFLAPPATQLTYKAWQQSTCRAVQTPSRSITPLDAQTSGRPLPDPVEKT